MKLRARFTLTLALAALVPITVAAVVTRQVVARSFRADATERRRTVEVTLDREIERLNAQVTAAVGSLTASDHPFTGNILRELVKSGGDIDPAALRHFREQSAPEMHGLSLDVLAVVGPDDQVLIAPHDRSTGEVNKDVRVRALAAPGRAYYATEKILSATSSKTTLETVLVAEAAQIGSDDDYSIAVLVGRRVASDLLTSVRSPNRVDARIVLRSGAVVVAPRAAWPARGTAGDAGDTDAELLRVPLPGPDGAPVAWIEARLQLGDLDAVLGTVTIISIILAGLALGATVLIGVLVARRMTRDLDSLVKGAEATARGDLEHRVAVRSRDEIGAVASSFNLMMEDLRSSKDRLVIAERIAAWQEIARRLAHEIKNPLTPIQMSMDTLRKTWRKQHPSFGEILEESTTTVLEEADRLKRIVTEFSDFARMPKPEVGPVDLGDIVDRALALYDGAVPIERDLTDGLTPIEADRGQLTQVLLNLVENARDAINSTPTPIDPGAPAVSESQSLKIARIWVRTRPGARPDRVELIVEDNGPGVPDELRDKVFAPYFTTKHGRGGTGLGLAIVQRIIADHGGIISVAEAAGGGARFVLELPIKAGDTLTPSRSQPTEKRPVVTLS